MANPQSAAVRQVYCWGSIRNVTLQARVRKPPPSAEACKASQTMPSRDKSSSQPPADAPVYSVRQLNREARRLLEDHFAGIWVSGEISRFTHHNSGHMYFDLKDADASVSCAMFRNSQRTLRFKPASGQQVLLQGKISIYEAGGRYQIIVDHMEEAGEGLLRRQFEELKARLQEEGLFADSAKQGLPALPATIGIVTSPTGAALRDILNILRRRYPAAGVILYPTRVQGEGAKEEIAAALAIANARAECDVLIVARGGGSLEDLWAFNEEIVARAIYASEIPVVSGVGHEIDFTIADMVADVRAPTPSGAAELIAPDCRELARALRNQERRAALAVGRRLHTMATGIGHLEQRLQRVHPGAVLREMQQRTDELTRALTRHLQRRLAEQRLAAINMTRRLTRVSPVAGLAALGERRGNLQRQLRLAMNNRLTQARQQAAALAGNLHAVSPLATLDRGYAIIHPAGKNTVISDPGAVKTGDRIEARLAGGRIEATVDKASVKPPTRQKNA